MKKIGIITILNVNNYGAELQAFSLQHKLRTLGYEVEIINYLYYKNPKFVATERSKPFFELKLIQKIKENLYPLIAEFKSIPYYKDKKKRDIKFDNFHKQFTNLSKEIRTIDLLYTQKFNYDIYIVGSDQVWNPNTNTNLEPYFLTFAPDDKIKISYASSFGVDNINELYSFQYSKLLNNLNKIAVRENNGVDIVRKLTGKNAQHVVDPTFLLKKTEWEPFAIQPFHPEKYLLLYVLTDSSYITDLAIHIAKMENLKIVRLCKNASKEDKGNSILNIIDAGPQEFLGWFMKASFVLTTSFHGVCFSINFNIPFYSVLKENKLNNSRQISLLSSLGLIKRILYLDDSFPETDLDIDYLIVNKKLNEQTSNSIQYLINSLER